MVLKSVQEDLIREGFRPFEVELGGSGVGILENFEEGLGTEFEKSIDCIHAPKEWRTWS